MTTQSVEPRVGIPLDAASAPAMTRSVAVARLEAGLRPAAATLAREAIRIVVIARSEQAAMIFTASSVACAGGFIIGRFASVADLPVVYIASVAPLAISLCLVAWIAAAFRQPAVPLSQAAERLDLSAGYSNAIATALDLAGGEERGLFVGRAIAHGLSQLGTLDGSDLKPRPIPVRRVRIVLSILGGLACVATVLLLPLPVRKPVTDPAGCVNAARVVAASFQVRRDNDPAHAAVPVPLQTRTEVGTTHTGTASPKGASPSKPAQNGSSSAATPSGGADGAADAATPLSASPRPPQSGKAMAAPGDSAPEIGTPASESVAKTPHLAAVGSESPKGAGAAGHAAGASADTAEGDETKSSKSEGAANAPKDAGGPSPSKPQAAKGDTASPGGDKIGKGKQAGTGQAVGIPDLNAAGGTGQGSGQNAPKKARGVPPLLLGTPMPDQLEGHVGLGPDTRSKSQTPPTPMPGDPDPAAVAQSRQGTEPPVPTCRVPGTLRGTVDAYFQRLHESDGTN